jgi:hypothetical protein
MPDPSFVRREVSKMLPIWRQIRDCIDGEVAIKGAFHPGSIPHESMGESFNSRNVASVDWNLAKMYLPVPQEDDGSDEVNKRYHAYITRAVFYPVTSRTIDGLTGEIFQRDYELTLPDKMKVMLDDLDGNGLNLKQFSQSTVKDLLAYGRKGILVDYPVLDRPATVQQINDGDIRPVFLQYDAWDVINWSTTRVGSKQKLSLLVLREVEHDVGEDEFSTIPVIQYRVLRLTAGVYTSQVWRDASANGGKFAAVADPVVIKGGDGKPLNFIPFQFLGAATNDWFVDKPPMGDIASLNIGHYRNSADYEESCFVTGQPTPVLSGLKQDWVDRNMQGKEIKFGSRKAILLGENSTAELLQVDANSMPMEAMKHKEEQMMAIGAKLITNNKTTRTATETTVQQSSENSTLGTIANNTSHGIEQCFVWAAMFMNIPVKTQVTEGEDKDIIFKLNDDFDINPYTPEEIQQMIAGYQAGVLTWTECRAGLRQAGLAQQTDTVAMAEIQKEKAQAFQMGGHSIADPFDIPPSITPPEPIPPPGSPADKAEKAKAAAAAKAASANKPTPKGGS